MGHVASITGVVVIVVLEKYILLYLLVMYNILKDGIYFYFRIRLQCPRCMVL